MFPLTSGGVILTAARAVRQRQHPSAAVAVPPRVKQIVTGPTGAEVSPGVPGALVPARSRGLGVGVVRGVVVVARDGCRAGVKRGRRVKQDAAPLNVVVGKPAVDHIVLKLLGWLGPADGNPGEADVPLAYLLPSVRREQESRRANSVPARCGKPGLVRVGGQRCGHTASRCTRVGPRCAGTAG